MKKVILSLCAAILLNYAQIGGAAAAESAVPGEADRGRSVSSTKASWCIVNFEMTRFFFKACIGKKDIDAQTLRCIKYMVQNSMKFMPNWYYLYLPECKDRQIENWRTIRNLDTPEEPEIDTNHRLLSYPIMQEINKELKKKRWPKDKSCLLRINQTTVLSPPIYDRPLQSLTINFLDDDDLPWGTDRILRKFQIEQKKNDEHADDKSKKQSREAKIEKILEERIDLLINHTQKMLAGQNLTQTERDFSNWILHKQAGALGKTIVIYLPPQCKEDFLGIMESIFKKLRKGVDYGYLWNSHIYKYGPEKVRKISFYSLLDIELFNNNFLKRYINDKKTLHSSDSVATSSAGA